MYTGLQKTICPVIMLIECEQANQHTPLQQKVNEDIEMIFGVTKNTTSCRLITINQDLKAVDENLHLGRIIERKGKQDLKCSQAAVHRDVTGKA